MFRIPVSTMRGQLVTSIVLLASLATVVVAALSFYFGRNWALRDVDQRIDAIHQTLVDSSFPLTESVILPLANLTKTEMISVSEDGRAAYSTLQTQTLPT